MARPHIIAYLKPSCGWSNGVRAILKKYDLPFEDRDIVNNPDHYQEMVDKSGQTLQPTIDVGGRIVADVSGDELEAWLVGEGIVSHSETDPGCPTGSCCSDEERAGSAAA